MLTKPSRKWLLLCGVSSALSGSTVSDAQTLTWIGVPNAASAARDVSNDGSVVVGYISYGNNDRRAFRWVNGVLTTLSDNSRAWGVSGDGSVVVGGYYSPLFNYYERAFRWTSSSVQSLGVLPNDGSSYATDVSADGSVVVGISFNSNRAFRWTAATGMQDLGTLHAGGIAYAYAVSADGAVVIGWASSAHNGSSSFRWTQNTGMQDIGLSLPNDEGCYANGISADGQVIVGRTVTRLYEWRPFRWTQSTGFVFLPTLGGRNNDVYDASADGSVLVGFCELPFQMGFRACRWRGNTIENLNQVYANLLQGGSILITACAVSADGRYIVGDGYNAATGRYDAFLLDTGAPQCAPHNGDVDNNGCVDDADLLAVLFAFGQTGQNLGRVDADCSGAVDDADLLIVLFGFGSGC